MYETDSKNINHEKQKTMSSKKQKLELTWVGKGEEPKLEPRILIEQPEYSYGDKSSGNILIHGDNLLALKALEQEYAGKIRCIFIDPPYNTGNAFEHYDDGIEHSLWLSLIKPRLELLRRLLMEDGSIWISIDDDESHYLKVLCDEVFGRINFVANVIWQKKFSPQNDAKWFSDMHDHILVYAKSKEVWRPKLLPRTAGMDERYKNPDNDPRGPWSSSDLLRKDRQESGVFTITTPSGRKCDPPPGRSWRTTVQNFEKMIEDNRIWFGSDGNNVPRLKRFLSEVKDGLTPTTVWLHTDVGHNQDAQKEVMAINPSDPFGTPKPEKLIQRIIDIASNPGDFVLDSFLGSGTTAAVAHKMGRRWVGIELGDHAYSHCYPRLRKVVEGEQGGISKSVEWKGGGGFRFYKLAPSLLNKDSYGNWVISKEYNPDMLAAAVAKHEGFQYQPDQQIFWKQGWSSEKDYIFTTTQFLTVEMLDHIHDEMKPDESLLIACKAYAAGCANKYPQQITVKKIPLMLMGKCEFGKEDYSLNIINIPGEFQSVDIEEPSTTKAKKKKKASKQQSNLFEEEE